MADRYLWLIVVTHARKGFRTSGPRLRVGREYTLTNLKGTRAEAEAEYADCSSSFPQYRLRLDQSYAVG